MGNDPSKRKGAKSHYSYPREIEHVDFQNKRFRKRTMEELYDLFKKEQLVHVKILRETEDDLEKVMKINKNLEINFTQLKQEHNTLKEKLERLASEETSGRRVLDLQYHS